MAIDPSNIVGYSLMGAGSGLVNRIMQHLFPTPLEKAQTKNIHENLIIARERLEREEARVLGEWNLRRELLLEQLAANKEIEQDRDLMRRWPLELPAAAFVRFSQRFEGASLNVIVRPITRVAGGKTEKEVAMFGGLVAASDLLMDSVPRYFDGDIIYYREVVTKSRDPARAGLEGQQLDAAMFSLAGTEPTALIQVSVEDPNAIRVRYSCWGWSGDTGFPMSGALILGCEDMSSADIEGALLSIICALHDQFRAVRSLGMPASPHLFKLLGLAGAITFRDDRNSGSATGTARAADVLVGSYSSALEIIAGRAPILAAESAAKAALAAHALSQPDLANRFLEAALRYCGSSSQLGLSDPKALINAIMSPRKGLSPPLLREAVQKVRALDPIDFIAAGGKMTTEDRLHQLEKFINELSPEEQLKLSETLKQMLTYTPKIAFFGKTGVGKSSLCNYLFGVDAFEVSDIEACTRDPQEEIRAIGGDQNIILLDVPGVGEDSERDEEYAALYRSLLPNIDALVWVLKADDRAYATDLNFYEEIVKPYIGAGTPFLIALNQIDKMPPEDWDSEVGAPSTVQKEKITKKIGSVAEKFGLMPEQVVAVSAEKKYGSVDLIDRIVISLPAMKKPSVVIATPAKNISKKAQESAQEAVAEEVEKAVGVGVGTAIGAIVGTFIAPGIGTALGAGVGAAVNAGVNWLKRKFFS